MNIKINQAVIFLCVALGLQACAMPKKVLQEDGYKFFAYVPNVIQQCAIEGHIDVSAAGDGLNMLKNKLNYDFIYDANQLSKASSEAVEQIRTARQTESEEKFKEVCKMMAIKIAEGRSEMASRKQEASQNQNTNQPLNNPVKNTYCNKIGTQTLCSTY